MENTNAKKKIDMVFMFLLLLWFLQLSGGQKIDKLILDGVDTVKKEYSLLVDSNVTVICSGHGSKLRWRHHHRDIVSDGEKWIINTELQEDGSIASHLTIVGSSLHHSGHYHCIIEKDGSDKPSKKNITLHFKGPPIFVDSQSHRVKVGGQGIVSCTFNAVPKPSIQWTKDNQLIDTVERFKVESGNEGTLFMSKVEVSNATLNDNGTFMCSSSNEIGPAHTTGHPVLIVQDVPNVKVTQVRPVSDSDIHVTWRVNYNNGAHGSAELLVSSKKSGEFVAWKDTEKAKREGVILRHLSEFGPTVFLKINATNNIGSSATDVYNVTLFEKKKEFIPAPTIRGSTKDSLTLSWTSPQNAELVGYYILSLTNPGLVGPKETVKSGVASDHLFEGLEAATKYNVTIVACLDLYMKREDDCGPTSVPVTGETLPGKPHPVDDVTIDCLDTTRAPSNSVVVKWVPSSKPKAVVDHYRIELRATAQYLDKEGRWQDYVNLVQEKVPAGIHNYTFSNVLPNTKYHFKISSGLKHLYSTPTSTICTMPVGLPAPEVMNWWKYSKDNVVYLKMPIPNVSERNGTICCYRVVVVKLAQGLLKTELPQPKEFELKSYTDVHATPDTGAYIAEAYSKRIRNQKYLLIGDGRVLGNMSDGCGECLGLKGPLLMKATMPLHRFHRSLDVPAPVVDGKLSDDANYTGFVIMSVRPNESSKTLSTYSNYFSVVRPVEDSSHPISANSSAGGLSEMDIIYIASGLFAFLLLVAVALCGALCLYRQKNKQLDEEEITDSLSGSLGRIFRSLRRSHTLISQTTTDVKPIPKDELVPVYLEKLKDSEHGFRKEYESLPEKFFDRTSRASEMLENMSKNRYPDIKAYDQTRVKLSQIDGIVGSDYINANYVLGYKERKKFICAQGPMEATVNDFWRMIVEQCCDMCVMLTNLEETGKVKCVKYWPEAGEPQVYGNITVRLVKEKAYSDYMVRTLRAEWEGHSAEGTEESKYHEVEQFHYLTWKDFVAPEHPVGVLSFLRRVMEAYSTEKGPLLVHCSAGVGRTGTLVALDSLVAQLEEEGIASIYNLICDLRHQRNFLVQSLKQYVFIHRALMEFAQFGNTELKPEELQNLWKKHSLHSPEDQSPIEAEFERLSKVIEDRKPLTIATSEENKSKNRYDYVLPYDSNRVILAPLATDPTSTYINASFLTGYDLAESFIVTQDPLESTITDFWRMVFDQEASTIVMLSELGSGEFCCGKYWPDDEETYEHICVKLTMSENYPKYSCRNFTLTNTKNGEVLNVTQFHYIGWTGPVGEVPLVTQGIVELVSRVQVHTDSHMNCSSPTVVHCTGGGDRSSVYVCLSNCLRQLTRESRVDVFQATRKIRSLRQFQLQEFSQYEFCYKALNDYIDIKGIYSI